MPMTRSASWAELTGKHQADESTNSDGKLSELQQQDSENDYHHHHQTKITTSSLSSRIGSSLSYGSPQKKLNWQWLQGGGRGGGTTVSTSFHHDDGRGEKSNSNSKRIYTRQVSASSDDPYHHPESLLKTRMMSDPSGAGGSSPTTPPPPPPSSTKTARNPYLFHKQAIRPRYLDHLETLLPQYCHHLSHPTYQEASNAMSLLLNSTPPPPTLSSNTGEFDYFFPLGSSNPEKSSSNSSVTRERGRRGGGEQQQRDANNNSGDTSATKSTVTSEVNRLLSSPFRVRHKLRSIKSSTSSNNNVNKNRKGASTTDNIKDNSGQTSERSGRWSNLTSSRSTLSSGGGGGGGADTTDHSQHGGGGGGGNNTTGGGGGGSTTSKPSAFTQKVDAASWADFVAPLILLAGAEAIYADLEHVHPNPTMIKWMGLYQRVVSEIRARLPTPIDEEDTEAEEEHNIMSDQGDEENLSSGERKSSSLEPISPPQASKIISNVGNTGSTPPNLLFPPFMSAKGRHVDPTTPPKKTTTTATTDLTTNKESPASVTVATSPTTGKMTTSKKKKKTKQQYNYKRLLSLCTWLDIKIRWLPLHESIYLTWSPENLMLIRSFAASYPNKDVCMDCSSGRLLEALQQEIQGTLVLMEMGHHLERGRFLETIVMARKVKKQLMAVANKETALVLWMRTTFQDYLSIMAVIFDKIHTFSAPLYGFDHQILLEATQKERTMLSDKKGVVDLDSLVIDLLRSQEKAGGTAMAVSIALDTEALEDDEQVLNATPTQQSHRVNGETHRKRHHHRVELGFAMQETQNAGSTMPKTPVASKPQPQQQVAAAPTTVSSEGEEKTSVLVEPKMWPAVYLRSSMRLGTQLRNNAGSNAGLGFISGMRRNANSRGSGGLDASSAPLHHGSGLLSQSRTSLSSDGMSPRSKFRKSGSTNRLPLSHGNIFEYETEPSIRPKWPHSQWLHLRGFLETMTIGGGAGANIVTDRLPGSPTSPQHRSGDPHLPPSSTFEMPLAVTLQPDSLQSEDTNNRSATPASPGLLVSSSNIFATQQLWDPLPIPSSTTIEGAATAENGNTTIHAVYLSDYMWLVVMVKGEEESRWHRRKVRGLTDAEIRSWLNGMASKLRISNRFVSLKTCQTARVKVKDTLAPRVRGRDLGLREATFLSENPEDNDNLQDEVLELMKEAFSISGSTAMNRAESILTTMSGGFRSSTGSRSPRDRRRVLANQRKRGPFAQNSDYREGAALLFLGPELFRQFLESTNE